MCFPLIRKLVESGKALVASTGLATLANVRPQLTGKAPNASTNTHDHERKTWAASRWDSTLDTQADAKSIKLRKPSPGDSSDFSAWTADVQ